MNKERQFGRDLGIFYGSQLHKVAAKDVFEREGAYELFTETFRKDNHSSLMKAATSIMEVLLPDAVSLPHMRALATKSRYDNDHVKEASDIVFDTVAGMQKTLYNDSVNSDFTKQAGSVPWWDLAGALPWILGTGAAIGGAGAGALYWHGDREVDEDEQENMAKEKKIKYYKRLVEELNQNMDNTYDLGS
jgi:hypothetical protein